MLSEHVMALHAGKTRYLTSNVHLMYLTAELEPCLWFVGHQMSDLGQVRVHYRSHSAYQTLKLYICLIL